MLQSFGELIWLYVFDNKIPSPEFNNIKLQNIEGKNRLAQWKPDLKIQRENVSPLSGTHGASRRKSSGRKYIFKARLTSLSQQTHYVQPNNWKIHLLNQMKHFWNLGPCLSHKASFNKFQRLSIIQTKFPDHDAIRWENTNIRLTLCVFGRMKNGVRNCKLFCTPSPFLRGIINSRGVCDKTLRALGNAGLGCSPCRSSLKKIPIPLP